MPHHEDDDLAVDTTTFLRQKREDEARRARSHRTRQVIYLAGPIAGCNDVEANRWREYVIANLGMKYDFKNPMVRDYRGDDTTPASEIVLADLADILESDILLVNSWQRSYGTIMEIPYGKMYGKHVIVVCPDKFFSPWLKYHANELYNTLGDAIISLS